MKTIKHYIEILLSFLLLVSSSANALSEDGPKLIYQLQPAVKWEIITSVTPTQHFQIGIKGTNESGEEQTFSLFCRKNNPALLANYDAKDVQGEYSNWGTNIALQWYPQNSTQAQELFINDQYDLMIPGRNKLNLRESMIEIKNRGENGYFAFVVYNVGMQGQVTTNVVSYLYPVEAAKQFTQAMMKQDYGMVCDTSTGSENVMVTINQTHDS